jgi:phosphate:Na+ symporter
MINLTRLATTLESVSEIAMTNMVTVTERRLAGGIDFGFLHDEATRSFGEAVFTALDEAVRLIGHPDPAAATRLLEDRERINTLAAAARHSVLPRLHLKDERGVLGFRLVSDMIDLFEVLARYARTIAESVRNL